MVKSFNNRKLIKYLLVLTVLLGSFVFAIRSYKKKIGFVDVNAVYQDYSLRSEYANELEKLDVHRSMEVDSLQIVIQSGYLAAASIKNESEAELAQKKIKIYYQRLEQIAQERQRMLEYYDGDIWSKINKHVENFAVLNKIDLLYGATGNGNLMYGNPDLDYTKALSNYIHTLDENIH